MISIKYTYIVVDSFVDALRHDDIAFTNALPWAWLLHYR